MTRFTVEVDCTATVLDDRTQTHKGGHCHKVISSVCARQQVDKLIGGARQVSGSHYRGYGYGPMYSRTGTCLLRNGGLDGLTDTKPTRTRQCRHIATGTVNIHQPGGTLVGRLNRMGFRQS